MLASELSTIASGTAALTIAIALSAGMIAQGIARHLGIPSIVVLLAVGVLLGPEVVGLVQPDSLGNALLSVVGFAMAVILFEGGMNLHLGRMYREGRPIHRLLTVGVVVTAAGAGLAAYWLLGWSWELSLLFGTLMIVTGPTVITPLLRRIRVERSARTVLEAEGIFSDAVGAIVSVVALEIVIKPSTESVFEGMAHVLLRLGFGAAVGGLTGLALALLLKQRRWIPEGLENVFTLSVAVTLFEVTNATLPESGIAACVAAGIVVGNLRAPTSQDLLEFKEQLTVLLIGLLFVILSADLRVSRLVSLGTGGLLTVAALMFVVRPLAIFAATLGTELGLRQRAFIAWIGPRGIVAAAVASFFAVELDRYGIEGGSELRALVFLVIAVTVVVAGLTGGPVSRMLGVDLRQKEGWLIFGANVLGRQLAKALGARGQEVALVDSNADACRIAESEGLVVLFGNGLSESILTRARAQDRAGVVAVTPNEEANLLFAQRVCRLSRGCSAYVSLESEDSGVTPSMLEESGARILFGQPHNVGYWEIRFRHDDATLQRWRSTGEKDAAALNFDSSTQRMLLPLLVETETAIMPVDAARRFSTGDVVTFAVHVRHADEVARRLRELGWEPDDEPPRDEERSLESAA